MKRRYISGSSKRKQKAARLRNEEKGKRTLEQLNWWKSESALSPLERATSSVVANLITEEVQPDNTAIEATNLCNDGGNSGENTGLENLTVEDEIAFDVVTTHEGRCDEFSSREVTQTTLSFASTPVHNNTGGESCHDQPAFKYSESISEGIDTISEGSSSTSSKSLVQVNNDVASWQSLSARERDSVVIMGPQRPPESLPKDSKSRSFPMSIFSRKMPNGENVARDWLVWSETAQSLLCFCCCLFATQLPSVVQSEFSHPQLGCKDHWHKLYEKALAAEKSNVHISNYMKWRDLILSLEKRKGIDSLEQQLYVKETERWREIIKSLLEATLHLAARNLPFRGSSSTVGDPDNGLFLGSLELIGNHDLTIKHHLETVRRHQERGERMQAHYLSWQSQNEFINLCADKVLREILSEIEKAFYYGLVVDGTPDISHTEQLTFIIRYTIQKNGVWKVMERFLELHDCEKKKGEDICKAILKVLGKHNIDISRCRGQGYDNGSNMSGCYRGVQALILEKNPQAIFAPCSAHSLNLCGVHAVEVAPEIKSFFGNIQRLYNLISCSPARWKILKETTGVSLHSLSDTRWSARIDAVKVLVDNHIKMLEMISNIKTELDLTALAFSDAENLIEWMKSFEYILMASFWFKVLQSIDDVNKVLQFADISIADEVKHLSSLQDDIQNIRDSWESILREAKLVAASLKQSTSLKEKRTSTRMAEEEFKINIFYRALDSLLVQLSERFNAVNVVASRFDFIINPPTDPSPEDVQKQVRILADSYPNDIIKDDLAEEIRHFVKFFEILGASLKRNRALSIINHIHEKKLECLYPQICICLRIFLSIPVSVASGERSFSKLALIKNRLRSTMSQDRLNSLMLLSIEHKLARSLDFEDLIDSFSRKKARKRMF